MTTNKTKTNKLQPKNYLLVGGGVNLTRLVDDAVAALENIHYNGVGFQRGRSRGVIIRSFIECAVAGGFSEKQARAQWNDQVKAIEALNLNADA